MPPVPRFLRHCQVQSAGVRFNSDKIATSKDNLQNQMPVWFAGFHPDDDQNLIVRAPDFSAPAQIEGYALLSPSTLRALGLPLLHQAIYAIFAFTRCNSVVCYILLLQIASFELAFNLPYLTCQVFPGNDQNTSPTNRKTAGSKLERKS